MAKVAISTHDLLLNFPLSGRHFILTNLTAVSIYNQAYLDASAIGTDLALKIKFYQYQMNASAIKFSTDIIARYIVLLTKGGSFSNLVKAYIGLEASKIPASINNPKDKTDLLKTTQVLVDATDEIAFSIKLLKTEIELVQITFQEIQKNYNDVLKTLVDKAGEKIKGINGQIEELKKKITENIEGIVKGGEDLSKGLADLGNGVIAQLKNIPSEKKEEKKNEKAALILKEKEPDPNFAIESIILSAQGVAKGSEATKALARNNKELGDLYQELKKDEAILSVAVATQVQNDFFIEYFEKSKEDASLLESDWVKVAGSCSTLKTTIDELSEEEAALQLEKEVNLSARDWTELQNSLLQLKKAFTGN